MNLHDFATLFDRFLPGALAFVRDFWSSLRTGEFWKRQRVWWRANGVFALIAFILASLLYSIQNVTHILNASFLYAAIVGFLKTMIPRSGKTLP